MKTLINQVAEIIKTKTSRAWSMEESSIIKNFIEEAKKVSNGDVAQWDMEGNFLTNDWIDADDEKRDNIFYNENTKQIRLFENRKYRLFSVRDAALDCFFPNFKI